jgi:magnesium chelatase family protein
LLDRIDLHVEVPTVKLRDIAAERTGESAAQIRERVLAAGAFSRSGSKVGRRSPATPGWDRGD